MKNQIRDLTKGSIKRQLFSLSLPIIGTSFIQMTYSIVDIAWVGRLGSESVAAIGSVGILMWIANSLALLNKAGGEVLVGRSLGTKDFDDARAFASQNCTMALILSILIGGIYFFAASPILSTFKMATPIHNEAISYLKIISIGIPFYFVGFAMVGVYNGSGLSKIPFYITGSGLVFNMILDPLFIFGLKMGTQGAAWATVISQITVFGLFMYQLRIRDKLFNNFSIITRLSRNKSAQILQLGIPIALLNILFAFVNMFLGRTASQAGGHLGLMALTTGGQVEAISWNTSQGFSTALSSFVSQNYGAGKIDRVKKSFMTTLKISGIFGFFITLMFVFFGTQIFGIVVPETEAALAGGLFLQIDGYAQMFSMIEITCQGFFYGLGRSRPPAIISILLNYARIPLAFFFVEIGMGLAGVWWAISISSMLKGAIALLWYVYKRKDYLKTT